MKKIRLSILLSAVLSISMLSACNVDENQGANDINYDPVAFEDEGRNDDGPRTQTFDEDRDRTWWYGQQFQLNNRYTARDGDNRYMAPRFGPDRQQDQQQERTQPAPAPEQPQQTQPQTQPDGAKALSEIERQVIELTNKERQKQGLPTLKADVKLAQVAQEKSNDMQENGYFSHNSPNYGSPFQMMQEFGVSYQSAAENIAAGQQSAEQVVQAWMNSPGHRRNIMNKELTHIGVGCAKGGRQGIYWTQMFIEK
ncbi:CAP domain-containing protein [Alkalihalobacillus sp. AL-G]|uniref:CAP domain-containing protein n=1 Tax=Alkalihalobacillus sp. AL-G TaxID=2926399 RepID=UPI00351BDC87